MLKRSLALFILLQPHVYVSRSTIFTNHAHAALCRVFNATSASSALSPTKPSSLPYHHTRSHYLLLRARTRRFNKLGSRHALSRMSLCAPWPNSRTPCSPRLAFSALSPKTPYPRVLDHTPTLPVCLILIRTSHYPSLCACTRQFDELHSRHPASAVENGRAPLVRIRARWAPHPGVGGWRQSYSFRPTSSRLSQYQPDIRSCLYPHQPAHRLKRLP